MSKYRIELTPSKFQRLLNLVLLSILLLSVWSWKSEVLHYQIIIQLSLSIILVLFFWRRFNLKQGVEIITVSENGDWIWLSSANFKEEQSDHWQITSASRMTPFWHWVVLRHPLSNQSRTHILCRDSVSEEQWRHLSRIIKQRKFQTSVDSEGSL